MEINITDKAAVQLKEMIKEKGHSRKKVRIMMTGIGWGGPRFGIALDEQDKNDVNFNANNLDFILEQRLANEIKKFYVDYKDFFLYKGFQVYADGYGSPFCWYLFKSNH